MVTVRHEAQTLQDLMDLPENTKAELIDGEIQLMAPARAKHSFVSLALGSKILSYANQLREKDISPSGTPPGYWILTEAWTHYDQYNAFVYDIAGFHRSELPQLPDFGLIMVTPFWVCEILSPSNRKNDLRLKKEVLEEKGVPHYWIADPVQKSIQVFRLDQANRTYNLIISVGVQDKIVQLEPFEELKLDLQQIFE